MGNTATNALDGTVFPSRTHRRSESEVIIEVANNFQLNLFSFIQFDIF